MNETSVITAFLDASVLYPALLRDVLMRLALHGLFRARWSALVQDEWCKALLRNRPDLSRDQLERTRRLMGTHMPDASVTGFEHRIADLVLPDANDRHVLAAAIHCEAQVIVTLNLRHFPDAALVDFDLTAMHPDAFIADLIREDEDASLASMRRLLAALSNPPMGGRDFLMALRRQGLRRSAETLAALQKL